MICALFTKPTREGKCQHYRCRLQRQRRRRLLLRQGLAFVYLSGCHTLSTLSKSGSAVPFEQVCSRDLVVIYNLLFFIRIDTCILYLHAHRTSVRHKTSLSRSHTEQQTSPIPTWKSVACCSHILRSYFPINLLSWIRYSTPLFPISKILY